VEQVRDLAAKLFTNKTPAMSAVGQLSHLSAHKKVTGYFSRS
jgi:hypothetical protein